MNPFFQKLLTRLRILPILIAVATLAFVVRIGDAVVTYKSLSGEAVAEDTSTKHEDKKEEPVKAADATADAVGTQPSGSALKSSSDSEEGSTAKDVTLPSMDKGGDKAEDKTKIWEDANDVDMDYSQLKEDMYKDLVDRRKKLDEREKTLTEREALLEAGQKELDRKYKELTGLRDEIQGLLKKQSEEEDSRLNSLVKIYTGMKPKDAARIFNTLDMDILVEVVGRMPEGKTSPILAAMEPDRARALTTLLAEQKKLPEVP
ncbi:MAG TPA: flagellar protein FlbB [Alphaproteobacteria bacterium]|nr:flagellar protein FlbB [Alphaproteobacteria bacterium]HNS44076.1 flagellar protein FlbB [Alphaproteobacteria bacterium]